MQALVIVWRPLFVYHIAQCRITEIADFPQFRKMLGWYDIAKGNFAETDIGQRRTLACHVSHCYMGNVIQAITVVAIGVLEYSEQCILFRCRTSKE